MRRVLLLLLGAGVALYATEAISSLPSEQTVEAAAGLAWWVWILILFISTFVLGVFATLGGVGGGVLFVPIVGSFFPFNLDFVRCTGLLIALSGALSAAPTYLRAGLANFRLAMPGALIASMTSIVGAFLGTALPDYVVRIALGATILLIAVIMIKSKRSERPEVGEQDALGKMLGINGRYREGSTGEVIDWHTHRTAIGFLLFSVIGLIAGMFGLGAGWANVPVLNLIMGVPLKVSVATSGFLLSITDTSAVWIYIHQGAMLPMMVLGSVISMMAGARIGALMLPAVKPALVRKIVILVMVLAGLRSLLKGLGI
jgi:uncharacterized protein